MLLGDAVFWLGIGMLAGGLFWRAKLRRVVPAGFRRGGGAPMALMLGGVVIAIAGLYLTGSL